MTSAPRSLKSILAYGPAKTLVKSTTFIPFRGGVNFLRAGVVEKHALQGIAEEVSSLRDMMKVSYFAI